VKAFAKIAKYAFLYGMLAIILSTQTVQVVQAQTAPQTDTPKEDENKWDPEFYAGNDIIFYDPRATCVPGASGSLTGGTAENPAPEEWPKTVWAFLIGKGLSPEQAAGVMGNLQQESTNYREGTSFIGKPFNPDATEFPGQDKGGYGIMQWTGGRRDSLKAAAAKQGVPVSSLAFQLEYLYQESNARSSLTVRGKNEWDGLKDQKTLPAAAAYWLHNAERPKNAGASVEKQRSDYGQRWYDELNGKVGASASAGCGVADNSSFDATVLSYAWPEYHRPPFTTAQPGYITALNRARAEGRYIGGTIYPGIDCGGFVTTLMYDSGFEKAYNYNARGGNTDSQRKWLDANWTNIGTGLTINPLELHKGDVAMLPGHTYVYVGDKGNKPANFGSVTASASQDELAPMASPENITASNTTWYRKR
jgi:hypothetical protein